MKLGVCAVLLGGMPLKEALDFLKKSGIESFELGAGGYPGKAHCNPEELLADGKKFAEFKSIIENCGMELNSFACHGNPIHPDKAVAAKYHKDFENAVLLAEKMGVKKIIAFSGCPGDCKESKNPNWVTCPWPDYFLDVLDYQWNDVLIPYWKKEVQFCKEHGIEKIAFEMHPGFCVYNPETLMKLRNAVDPMLGANFDPSHLIWQQIDPVSAIRYLGNAIYHVHAKDTKIDISNTKVNGVLDTKPYNDEIHRSWVFRTVGYGNGYDYWKDMISNLRLVGYDDILAIEHEDSLMSNSEGLQKAVSFLKECIITEKPGEVFWINNG